MAPPSAIALPRKRERDADCTFRGPTSHHVVVLGQFGEDGRGPLHRFDVRRMREVALHRLPDVGRRQPALLEAGPGAYGKLGVHQIGGDQVLRIKRREPPHQVFQLAHISRPGMPFQPVEGRSGDAFGGKPLPLALAQDGVTPSGYGLGDSGWVNVDFGEATLPYDMLRDWIPESYRAVAPKKLSATLR